MCEKCVSPKMAAKIELVQDVAGDFSDGAYFAFCEEQGVGVEDLEAYFEEHKKGGEKDANKK